MKTFTSLFYCLLFIITGSAQTTNAEEILSKSIRYHDPQGVWGNYRGSFTVIMESPGRENRLSDIYMDQPASLFRLEMTQGDVVKTYEIDGDSCELRFNGSPEISDEIAEKHRLTCGRAQMYKNYYTYLYGLPMKLRDPGTQINPEAKEVTFKGKLYWVLEVQYDPGVGKDLWYFYFNRETFALEVYQFYHDKAKNDGEYILLSGEQTINGMRLPKIRTWYTNKEEKLLGTDILQDL